MKRVFLIVLDSFGIGEMDLNHAVHSLLLLLVGQCRAVDDLQKGFLVLCPGLGGENEGIIVLIYPFPGSYNKTVKRKERKRREKPNQKKSGLPFLWTM